MTGRILVTGAAGFLGYHLAETLARDLNNQLVCVDNFSRGVHDDLYKALLKRGNVRGIDVDLSLDSAMDALPDDIDVIYHLAALNGTQNFYERPLDVLRSCTLPTFNLIEKYGPAGRLRRFFYAGTSEAYASIVTQFNWEVPTGEDVPLGIQDVSNPRWSYAVSKMHGEVLTIQGCRQFGIPFTVGRYHNAYGPRMGDKHVIPDFLMRMKIGRCELFGWEDTRTFLYADDAVAATIAVSEADCCAGEIINIGGKHEITMQDLGLLIMKICDVEGQLVLHPSPAGSVKRRAPKVEKLYLLTGFQERWSLEDGLKKTAEFYLA